jgi:hypothetical protein
MLSVQVSRFSRWLGKRFDIIGQQGLTLIDDVLPTIDIDSEDIVHQGGRGDRWTQATATFGASVGNINRVRITAPPSHVIDLRQVVIVNPGGASSIFAGPVLPLSAVATGFLNCTDLRYDGTLWPGFFSSDQPAAGGSQIAASEWRWPNATFSAADLKVVIAPGRTFAFATEASNVASDWMFIMRAVPVTAQEVNPA